MKEYVKILIPNQPHKRQPFLVKFVILDFTSCIGRSLVDRRAPECRPRGVQNQ